MRSIYFCNRCKRSHYFTSKIGQLHSYTLPTTEKVRAINEELQEENKKQLKE